MIRFSNFLWTFKLEVTAINITHNLFGTLFPLVFKYSSPELRKRFLMFFFHLCGSALCARLRMFSAGLTSAWPTSGWMFSAWPTPTWPTSAAPTSYRLTSGWMFYLSSLATVTGYVITYRNVYQLIWSDICLLALPTLIDKTPTLCWSHADRGC